MQEWCKPAQNIQKCQIVESLEPPPAAAVAWQWRLRRRCGRRCSGSRCWLQLAATCCLLHACCLLDAACFWLPAFGYLLLAALVPFASAAFAAFAASAASAAAQAPCFYHCLTEVATMAAAEAAAVAAAPAAAVPEDEF